MITVSPIFGALFQKAKSADSPKELLKSQEAASALTVYGSSITGSAIQSYAVGALLNLTGTVTYKGASYLGGLIFLISQTPQIVNNVLLEKRPVDLVIAKIVASLLETIGLSLTLTWWGTRTNSLTIS
ncbi:hypothetical protein D0Z00_000782 [Geotrichum galactomycetum]|uniref:Uncharacterized protein n=1 Tax=Geotrichum galactomycetum TaxID=27317 RepID=A0ACB6V934_9ASCO|nr:hypothetical protein D0Z00_000782 [Geotrichum candidum]